MKRLYIALLLLLCVYTAFAGDSKLLRIPPGQMTTEDVPFPVENISLSNGRVVRVETMRDNPRQIRLIALATGLTDLELRGAGMVQNYTIVVVDDLRNTLNAIKRNLDEVTELDYVINDGRIVLKGQISSIANMELKSKVVKAYGNVILDLSTFWPTPEVLRSLKNNFERAGFAVVRADDGAGENKPGELSMMQTGDRSMTIYGNVYNKEDVSTITNILSTQPWLSVNDGKAGGTEENKVRAYLNVKVNPVMLQVDIVHIAVDTNELHSAGNELVGLDQLLTLKGMFVSSVVKIRHGDTEHHTGGLAFAGLGTTDGEAASLAGIVGLLGQNGFTRVRRSATLTFRSDDGNEWRELHSGATHWVSSAKASVDGNLAELVKVDTGLKLKVRGGLTGKDKISLDINQELSTPTEPTEGEDFKVATNSYNTAINCKLGETVALGGLVDYMHVNTNTASIPYLRNVPILKWCISKQGDNFTTVKILTLVCVRKMLKPGETDQVAVELNKFQKAEDKLVQDKKEEEAERKKAAERKAKERERERRKKIKKQKEKEEKEDFWRF